MITPEYLRRITERMQRIAQDMEDEMLAIVVVALLLNEEPTEELGMVAESYAEYGVAEIDRAFADAVKEIAASAQDVAENAPNATPAPTTPSATPPTPSETTPSTPTKPTTPSVPTRPSTPTPPNAPNVPKTALPTSNGKIYIPSAPNAKMPTPVLVDANEIGLTPHEVNETAKEMKESWYNLTQTQAYAANEQYVRKTDEAYLRVTTEDVPLDKALQTGVDELAQEGLTVVINKREEHTDVAMARNLRTAIARLAGEASLQQALMNGYTLVLVSAHLGARPTHEVWQGKIFSLLGDTDKYKDFFRETGYGQIDGLCGVNCRHTFAPWREGMGNPFADVDPEESRKRYELEQKQRAMERRIRALKRKVKALQAEVDATGEPKQKLKDAKAELREAKREYKEFCAANDLRELTERLRVDD